MVTRLMLVAVCCAGCGGALNAMAPPTPKLTPKMMAPYNADYALLARVSASTCSDLATLKVIRGSSSDPEAIEPHTLYEQAKFAALEKVPEADELVAVRSERLIGNDGQICVRLSGRAVKIVALQAGSPSQHQAERAKVLDQLLDRAIDDMTPKASSPRAPTPAPRVP